MNDLQINPRFHDLLPPLTKQEYEQLEESILEEGIRDPVRAWRNQIVDGHNRAEIAEKHDLGYTILDMFFEDEDEACEWIIVNQLARRNFEPHIKTLYIGQLYELRKKRSEETAFKKAESVSPLESGVATAATPQEPQEPEPPKRTAEKIAEEVGVSPRTVRSAAKVHEAFEQSAPEIKDQFKRGEITQKKLVESVKPEQPKPTAAILDDDEQDDVTRIAKDLGKRIRTNLKEFRTLVDDATNALGFAGTKPLAFLNRLADTRSYDALLIDAERMARFIKCPVCKVAKCEHCSNLGYIDKDQKKQVLDRVEHIARGGVTV